MFQPTLAEKRCNMVADAATPLRFKPKSFQFQIIPICIMGLQVSCSSFAGSFAGELFVDNVFSM